MERDEKAFRDFVDRRRLRAVRAATRIAVDSISGKSVRLVMSRLAGEVAADGGLRALARFSAWSVERERIVRLSRAAALLRVRATRVVEGTVFVRVRGRVFEITPFVRTEAKRLYVDLVRREGRFATTRPSPEPMAGGRETQEREGA